MGGLPLSRPPATVPDSASDREDDLPDVSRDKPPEQDAQDDPPVPGVSPSPEEVADPLEDIKDVLEEMSLSSPVTKDSLGKLFTLLPQRYEFTPDKKEEMKNLISFASTPGVQGYCWAY